MVNPKIIQEWLKKADSDLNFASDALKDTEYFDQICFLFQQAAEKFLKAVIVARDLPFRKVHDLGVLLKIIITKFSEFRELQSDCDFLTSFYVEARYPDSPGVHIIKETAIKGQKAAENIAHFIQKFLHV